MKVFFRKRKIIEEMEKKLKDLEDDIRWLKKDAQIGLQSNKILNYLVNYLFDKNGKSYAINISDALMFEKMDKNIAGEKEIKKEGYILSNSFSCRALSGSNDDVRYIKVYIKE